MLHESNVLNKNFGFIPGFEKMLVAFNKKLNSFFFLVLTA